MRLVLTNAAWIGLAVSIGGVPLLAQLQDNSEKQMTCSNAGNDRDRARHCEIREQSLPSIGRLSVDASPNGGVTVKGWLRGDVLVRARVEASSDTEGPRPSTAGTSSEVAPSRPISKSWMSAAPFMATAVRKPRRVPRPVPGPCRAAGFPRQGPNPSPPGPTRSGR